MLLTVYCMDQTSAVEYYCMDQTSAVVYYSTDKNALCNTAGCVRFDRYMEQEQNIVSKTWGKDRVYSGSNYPTHHLVKVWTQHNFERS